MDGEQRFYKRTWFYVLSWTAVAGIGYLVSLYFMKLGDAQNYIIFLFIDAILFLFGLIVWLAFFAQFILPVSRFRERQKIFDRLVGYLFGSRGPAIFVEDGIPFTHKGEKEKTGPGVVWLDSASAAQLRTVTKFTRTIGPGVHFTENGEYLAGAVDLHFQSQGIGPNAKDEPLFIFMTEEQFAKNEQAREKGKTLDEFIAIQKRRGETSALTRDGIEVVPTINVVFKIDAEPVEGDSPGSRFGYPQVLKKEMDNPVFKAIAGEGINPNRLDKPRDKQLVAWNKLPAIIAADLWREYLSKFTLRDLFTPSQDIPPEQHSPLQPAEHETTALYEPVRASAPQNAWQDGFAEILHELNRGLHKLVDYYEKDTALKPGASKPPSAPSVPSGQEPRKGTALEVISAMMKARMVQQYVEELDDHGKRFDPTRERENNEFKWLKDRGLKVISVSVSNLRFTPVVEEQLVRQWNVTWLVNAKGERDAIERLRKIAELQGREKALNDYARALGKGLFKEPPAQTDEALSESVKKLVTRTRSLIYRNNRLHRRLSSELDDLDEILKWLER